MFCRGNRSGNIIACASRSRPFSGWIDVFEDNWEMNVIFLNELAELVIREGFSNNVF